VISKLAKISWISTQKNGAAKHTKKENEKKMKCSENAHHDINT
jgi:hypothetical protein